MNNIQAVLKQADRVRKLEMALQRPAVQLAYRRYIVARRLNVITIKLLPGKDGDIRPPIVYVEAMR